MTKLYRPAALLSLLPFLMARGVPRGDNAPRDLASLFALLEQRRNMQNRLDNLLTQWGPANRPLISAQFLPPRLLTENEATIERVNWRTVAAEDTTRHSPAPLLDGGEIFGSIKYALRDSKIARQLTPRDYDGLVRYLNRRMPLQAAAEAMGLFESMIVQSMTEHDELANCDAIVTGGYARRGNNGYYEYQNGPVLENHRVVMGHDWSDPAYDFYPDIIARIQVLTNKGFQKSGIRGMTTDQVNTIMKSSPYSAIRAGKSNLVTNSDGTIRAQTVGGIVTDDDLNAIWRSLGVQVPVTHDLRVPTRTGEKRAFAEGALAFIAATGQTEQVVYNQNDPAAVPLQVDDTIGFSGIGVANAQDSPGRRTATRVYANQSDARVEMEGWQTTGPVINIPEAISVATGIE